MTGSQALSFAIVIVTVAVFAWGRFRYDLVSLVALLAGIATGDVPAKEAFSGFTSDVVIVIASALVVSAAVARSGVIETVLGPALARLKSPVSQVPALAAATALLSMLTKNVGALAILMPTAMRLGRQEGSSVAALLMPMSFLSLLGGLVTLVGTSTNIIVSQVREQTLGQPFNMFDFAPVGLTLTALGLLFVSIGWRLLPRDRQGTGGLGDVAAGSAYTIEAEVADQLPEGGTTIGGLKLDQDGVRVSAVIGHDGARTPAMATSSLQPGQKLVLQGEDAALARVLDRTPLQGARADKAVEKDEASEETRSIEAVVQPDSRLVGSSAERQRLQDEHGVKLIAVSRRGERFTERLRDITLQAGDVLVLQAGEKALPGAMAVLGLLPLAERMVKLGGPRRRWAPLLILTAAIVLVALKIAPVAAAFFGAAVLVVVVGSLSLREAYSAFEPEVLVLIGALTPLSEAVEHSGGTALLGHQLALVMHGAPPLIVLGALMVTAMACSPFLHNAPTVLVLGPIGVAVAKQLGLSPDPFLMAVATGAGCDFLTPVGHQCNTLVRGPGGYRFSDYSRLGAPLSVLVILVGTPLIAWVWPLTK